MTLLTEKPLAGTGLKIKSVEALCRAKPLVAGPNSVEGLLSAGEPSFIMCRIWTTFSDAVITLLESEDKRFELQRHVLGFARRHFHAEQVYAALACLFPRPEQVFSDVDAAG